MDSITVWAASQYGLIGVAIYLIYYIIKRNRYLENKFIEVVENNTKVMQEVKDVINEFRHEIKRQLDRIENKIDSKK